MLLLRHCPAASASASVRELLVQHGEQGGQKMLKVHQLYVEESRPDREKETS